MPCLYFYPTHSISVTKSTFDDGGKPMGVESGVVYSMHIFGGGMLEQEVFFSDPNFVSNGCQQVSSTVSLTDAFIPL